MYHSTRQSQMIQHYLNLNTGYRWPEKIEKLGWQPIISPAVHSENSASLLNKQDSADVEFCPKENQYETRQYIYF